MKQSSSLYAKLCASPYVVWSLIFVLAPLIFVGYYAFTDAQGVFTLSNILDLNKYGGLFIQSILYGLITTVICLLVAFPFAYMLSMRSVRYQSTIIMLIMLPMWMNLLIRTYSWMNILEDNGIINTVLGFFGVEPITMLGTPGAVILGMVYNFLPYMILPIYTVITKMDKNVIEAAQDLGCNRFNVMTKVTLPLCVPGIASGITMVFVPSVSTFYISQKLGGTSDVLVGDMIEFHFKQSSDFNIGAALSLVLMILLLICMAFMNTFTGDDDENGGMIV